MKTSEQIAETIVAQYLADDNGEPLERAELVDICTAAAREAQTPPDFKPPADMDALYRAVGHTFDTSSPAALLQVIRELIGSAPDFKSKGEPDEYRDEWNKISGYGCLMFCLEGTGDDESATSYLTASPDQARRILAMLSTEANNG